MDLEPNTIVAGDLCRIIIDAVPLPVFVVDHDIRILDYNTAAAELMSPDPAYQLRRRGGDILHCLIAEETSGGCGNAPYCKDCLIKRCVYEAFQGHKVIRHKSVMEVVKPGEDNKTIHLLVTATPMRFKGTEYVLLILEDVSELISLRQLLPICCNCKKIRDDQNYWQQVDQYFKKQLELDFTHCLCPECAQKLYPELFRDSESTSSS